MPKDANGDYSGGSNTEQVWYSDGQWRSVQGPEHLNTKFQNGRSRLGCFIYKENLYSNQL